MQTEFQGAIFDVDGVLVDSPHEAAWRESLRELMESQWSDISGDTTWTAERFTPQVYQQVMYGKPRMSGARAALDYFEVPDAETRVEAYAERKQTMVIDLIEAGEFTAYPDALRFIIAVKDAGIRVAAASSSKNAGPFLRQIRLDTFAEEQGIASRFIRPGLSLLEFFDADVSGRDFAHGKPHPEMFLTAAQELAIPPEHSFVIDARRRRPRRALRRALGEEGQQASGPRRRHRARPRRADQDRGASRRPSRRAAGARGARERQAARSPPGRSRPVPHPRRSRRESSCSGSLSQRTSTSVTIDPTWSAIARRWSESVKPAVSPGCVTMLAAYTIGPAEAASASGTTAPRNAGMVLVNKLPGPGRGRLPARSLRSRGPAPRRPAARSRPAGPTVHPRARLTRRG